MEDNLFEVYGTEDPMDRDNLISALESILFAAGEAVKKKDLMKILNISERNLESIIAIYSKELDHKNRGIKLLLLENKIQLATKDCHAHYLKELLGVNDRQSLSKGALESLSIIAFKQPVTRVEVDEIRGVNSDYVMGKLQEKGLIKALGRMDAPGRPKLYGTTDDFLIQFGFTSLQAMKEEHKLPEDIWVKNHKEKPQNEENEDSTDVE